MDTLDQMEMGGKQEIVTQQVLSNMQATAPWMMVMGVFFVIGSILMVLAGASVVYGANAYSSIGMVNAMRVMGLYYILSGSLIGYGGVLCLISGTRASSFAKFPSSKLLVEFTNKQKTFWILMAINAIITVVFAIVFVAMAGKLASIATKM
jgi:hypothetical protein